MNINLNDTIGAISTPVGEGGIGIARLSGSDALAIADKIFVSKNGGRLSESRTHTMHYGWIVDAGREALDEGRGTRDEGCGTWDVGHKASIIDEVMVTVMRAPKTYTKEDIIEINCHGGIVALRKVIELVLSLGVRLAEPGEFTKRAFLNGRIDLTQAESVLDIIRAKTQKGLKTALLQLDGGVSNAVRELKNRLIDIKAHLEAAVDFPDEQIAVYSAREILERLETAKRDMAALLRSFEFGKVIRDGISCVICGRANVGKSSLMNELLKEERVIVTPIAGTTRDAICEYVNINGIPVNIVDTAGILKTKGLLEREGMRVSRLWIDKADMVLFMLDAGADFSDEDKEVIELIKNKEVVCVINKIDLERRLNVNAADLEKCFGRCVPLLEISVLQKINLGTLLKSISDKVWKGEVSASDDIVLTNVRHKNAILRASELTGEAVDSLKVSQPEEIVSISLREAILALGEVTGESVTDEVLERIFEQFCVGK